MCWKAGQKLSASLRLSPYLNTNKRKTISTAMVKSQLNYCPLVWMFFPRRSSNLINKVQESASYNLQRPVNRFTIHQRNLRVLMTELYKIKITLLLQ